MVAGGLYEHLVVEPSMKADLSSSLSIVQPPNGLRLDFFWILIHSVATLALFAATVANWRIKKRRSYLLLGDALYVAVRVWSFAYFIPEMMDFQRAGGSAPSSCTSCTKAAGLVLTPEIQPAELIQRVFKWCSISWVRTVMILVQHVLLMMAVTTEAPSAAALTSAAATTAPARIAEDKSE